MRIPVCVTTAFSNSIKFRENIQIVCKGKATLVDSYSLADFLFTFYSRLDLLPCIILDKWPKEKLVLCKESVWPLKLEVHINPTANNPGWKYIKCILIESEVIISFSEGKVKSSLRKQKPVLLQGVRVKWGSVQGKRHGSIFGNLEIKLTGIELFGKKVLIRRKTFSWHL